MDHPVPSQFAVHRLNEPASVIIQMKPCHDGESLYPDLRLHNNLISMLRFLKVSRGRKVGYLQVFKDMSTELLNHFPLQWVSSSDING
mmetsp:Transcript_18738/g.61544  ORF Transcript_18738/g.61544 Transcript_18738/m.61544 type:complete len:88 (+) Transcript_18738:1353-1616(+)